MGTIFMSTEKNKTNEQNKFVLNLSQRLDLRCLNKDVTFQNLSFYCTWENIRKQYKNNNNLKIITPAWNDKFEFPDSFYSVSHIQNYIEYIIKNMKH